MSKRLTYEQAKRAISRYQAELIDGLETDSTLLWERCLAEAMNWRPDDTENSDCEIRWCDSGEPATVDVTECFDDGAWSVGICKQCADKIGVKAGDTLPDSTTVQTALGKA